MSIGKQNIIGPPVTHDSMTSVFEHLSRGDLDSALLDQDHTTLSPFLPYLAKLLQVVQGPHKVQIIRILHHSDLAPTLHRLFRDDFTEVLTDALKEQELRKKCGTRREDSTLCSNAPVDTVFAGSDIGAKVRVIAAEVIYLESQCSSQTTVSSDLFSYTDYRDLINAVLCVLCYRIPEVFDMKTVLKMLVNLTNDTRYFMNRLVVNNPVRYPEILQCLVDLFVESKGNLEQKVLSCLKDISALVSDSSQYITLDLVSNIRKRVMLQSVLAPDLMKCTPEQIILSLFSEKDSAPVIDFIKNESKAFEHVVRFSDFREKLLGILQNVTCGEDVMNDTMDTSVDMDKSKDTFYCSFLDDSIKEDLTANSPKSAERVEKAPKVLTLPKVVRANQLLILYLNMVNTCRLSLFPRECRELVNLMVQKPCSSEEGDLFIKLSLSIYMSCTSLNSTVQVGDVIRTWLKELLNYSYEGGRKAELILLTGMHLHSGTYEMIGPILSQTSGLTINVSAGHAATVQTLWSQLQTEDQIVSALADVPVTPNLCGHVTGYLPVHCLSQLITSRIPSCPPNFFTWLPLQLRETCEPVHPVLCQLISGCVNYLMSNKGRGMSGISEAELLSLLSPTNSMACRVLAFYYLLLHRKAFSDLKQKADPISTFQLPTEYSASLLGDDSAKTLLLHTRNNKHLYAAVYPTFIKLLVVQFPFLCDPQALLAEDETKAHVSKLSKNSKEFDVMEYMSGMLDSLEKGDECKSYYMISKMLKRHHEFIPSEIVARCVPHVANLGFRIQDSFTKLWEMSAALNPQTTWLNTAKILIDPNLTEDDIWVDPLQLLQIPPEVSKTTVGVKILLHMLRGYLSLCSARLTETGVPCGSKSKEHEEKKSLFLTLQNSAIVQLLLDLTDRTSDDSSHNLNHLSPTIESDHLYENSALVYNFLHDFFINNDGLSKLVCWQTFKFSQIEGVVNGVPSLHVACKFTTSMFSQPLIQKQLFGVCLLSHLAIQYPVQQTLQACNEMLQWATTQNGLMSTLWTLLSLDSFLRMVKAFPPLADPIIRILMAQRKLLSNYNSKTIKEKLKMYSDLDTTDNRSAQQMIDSTFQTLITDILVRMKGT